MNCKHRWNNYIAETQKGTGPILTVLVVTYVYCNKCLEVRNVITKRRPDDNGKH